jgi:hypothetical protein
MTSKPCSRCGKLKPVLDFHKDKYKPTGYKSQCKVCSALDFSIWRNKNLIEVRKQDRINHYINTYKLSKEEASAFVLDRTGICSICKQETLLVIDHCHTTGKVRGRICASCNSVLGYSKDRVATLENAILYLKEFYNEA